MDHLGEETLGEETLGEETLGEETAPRITMHVLEADGSWGESDITGIARELWKLGKLHPRENPENGVEMIRLESFGVWDWDGESDEEALGCIGNAVCFAVEEAVAVHRDVPSA